MSEQPINQWNMTTEPSDMMKINTPMPITVAPSPSNQTEVIDDDSFSYDGYQVVRGEFFAHIYEPSFTFNNYKVSVNSACIKKLPDVEYVQILVNPIEKKLAVRPCREEEKDSFRWCSSGKKRSPKQITCRIFFAKVISLMDWNPNYRYKILGKLIRSGNEILFIFDLTSPEIFPRTLKDNGTVTTARTPSYPEEWKNQFGIPVEEHQKSMQVNIFEGYAVFDIQEKKKATDKSIEKAKEPSTAESEEKSYEQQTLFPSTKKNRIRIHRNTLRQIGNPEYIQLLVNPDQKMIGIKASCAEDKLAHKVKDYFVINGNSYELYSRELLYSLSQLNLSWEKFNIFRLEGNIYPDKKIALFSMDNIITKLPQTEFKSEIMGDEYAQL